MRKVIVGGLLLLALALTTVGVKQTDAQAKKSVSGVIEIGEGKDGRYRFFVRDNDGKLVAMSSPRGFASVKDAETEIGRLKQIASKAKVTMLKKKTK